ncbi:MAG: hypothetical protein AAF462_09805 [Thermodesulfobacteriota bacterium]
MKNIIVVMLLILFGVSFISIDTQAKDIENMGAQMMLGSDQNPGMFCNIESVNVCVLAENEDDCTKLKGEKVDSCPQPSGE